MLYAGEEVNFGRYLSPKQKELFRSTFPVECCASCKFWMEHEKPTFHEDVSKALNKACPWYRGTCRIHAPVILVPVQDDCEPDVAWWPDTGYDDWCGEWTQRDGSEWRGMPDEEPAPYRTGDVT